MTTIQEFNRLIRHLGRVALSSEAALARRYEQALNRAGRIIASTFEATTVTAAADWVPPEGEALNTEALLAAARDVSGRQPPSRLRRRC